MNTFTNRLNTLTNRLRSIRRISSRWHSEVKRPKVHFLDLQDSGLSAIERLCLEEALLRHDPLNRSWAIVGTHHPSHNKLITIPMSERKNLYSGCGCLIILGIGGKPNELLNTQKVKEDGIMTIKRFSGGGTVVVDHSSLWTTFIGRNTDFPHVQPYPRNIMEWSAKDIFHNAFERMKADTLHRNQGDGGDNVEYELPEFKLQENDYVLGGRKMGGNAQSITGKGWLHHTSFLWDFEEVNMEYLTLPPKRPTYRKDRDHSDFLIKLKAVFGSSGDDDSLRRAFFYHVKTACIDSFQVEETRLSDAMKVVDDELGGMQDWFEGKCRTKIISL